jgi:hypothetical protein
MHPGVKHVVSQRTHTKPPAQLFNGLGATTNAPFLVQPNTISSAT